MQRCVVQHLHLRFGIYTRRYCGSAVTCPPVDHGQIDLDVALKCHFVRESVTCGASAYAVHVSGVGIDALDVDGQRGARRRGYCDTAAVRATVYGYAARGGDDRVFVHYDMQVTGASLSRNTLVATYFDGASSVSVEMHRHSAIAVIVLFGIHEPTVLIFFDIFHPQHAVLGADSRGVGVVIGGDGIALFQHLVIVLVRVGPDVQLVVVAIAYGFELPQDILPIVVVPDDEGDLFTVHIGIDAIGGYHAALVVRAFDPITLIKVKQVLGGIAQLDALLIQYHFPVIEIVPFGRFCHGGMYRGGFRIPFVHRLRGSGRIDVGDGFVIYLDIPGLLVSADFAGTHHVAVYTAPIVVIGYAHQLPLVVLMLLSPRHGRAIFVRAICPMIFAVVCGQRGMSVGAFVRDKGKYMLVGLSGYGHGLTISAHRAVVIL